MLRPMRYVFVFRLITMASIGFNGPIGAATGGGGSAI
jgi:hypothetical protein